MFEGLRGSAWKSGVDIEIVGTRPVSQVVARRWADWNGVPMEESVRAREGITCSV